MCIMLCSLARVPARHAMQCEDGDTVDAAVAEQADCDGVILHHNIRDCTLYGAKAAATATLRR